MAQYIDKSAVVAEIERRLKAQNKDRDFNYLQIKELEALLSFIDTFEVKEVDLNREIEKEIETRWRGEYLFTTKFKESAKHFFELGLKAQKGE